MHLSYETFIFIFGLIFLYLMGVSAALVGYVGKIIMLTIIVVLTQYNVGMGLALTIFYLALIDYNYNRLEGFIPSSADEGFIDPPDNEETGALIFEPNKENKNNVNITSGKELITREEKLRPQKS